MVGASRDKRTCPAATPGAFRNLTLDASPTTRIADGRDRGVVDLDVRRTWRLLADLDLAPTVPVPCSGCCRCYGTPIGAECRP
jgi:hypothetical protein